MTIDNTGHEGRLVRMEAKMDALHARIDEVVVTQLRDQGKRMRELESEVREMREYRAREDGKKAGSKAVLGVLLAIVAALSSAISAMVTKFF